MKPSDFQKTIQCQFDCKLKRVVKGIVRNYRKELKRRRNKEISYCELPEIVVENLAVWDEYVIRQIKRCRFHQIKTGLSEHLTMG